MSGTRQLDALTGVRGIAAWLVVLYHIREGVAHALPAPVIAVFAKGYLAVDLFFVLSGFVLWLTWGGRFARDGLGAAPDFWRKRVARVWPLHVVILTATVAFALVVQATGRPVPPHYRWDELPLHVLLIQNWGFTRDIAWNDPSWSISTEMAAYLLFPFAAIALARLRPSPVVATGIALALIVALDRLFASRGSALLGHDIAGLGLWRCLTQFGCGVAMCLLWQQWQNRRMVAVTALASATALALWTTGLLRETFAIPLAFTALVPWLAATSPQKYNPLSSRIAVALGEISYSTYLAHFLLWTVFKIVFVGDPRAVPLEVAALYLALTLAASFVLYRFIEVPARRWLGTADRIAGALSGNPATP
ncbi:acyltransferase [Sphingomonas sp. SUN039]|uniref:acyltransferase family protein n=1 Tax=Sphingomonas sp. SUN039 TaxID=2937787 RepID=UPI0021641D8C|nr:acyltransferase [Sphingomonas sp. SUN039]UVO52737.1 acyltransferase [Sphingomonas sp. SUN039]